MCDTPAAVAARKKAQQHVKIGATVAVSLMGLWSLIQLVRDTRWGGRRGG